MNLDGWFTLGALAEESGVDVWNFRTADGRSLRAALDYLVPFAGSATKWPHPQITPIEWAGLVPLLDQAASVWNAVSYRTLADRLRPAGQ